MWWDSVKSKIILIVATILVPLMIILAAVGVWMAIENAEMKPKIEELAGTWEGEFSSDLSWEDVLVYFEFCDKELEILRTSGIARETVPFIDSATFTKDKTFVIDSNNEASKRIQRECLERIFDAFYQSRDLLRFTYNTDFSSYTKEQFELYYATLYSYDSFDLLLDEFAEDVADYYIAQTGIYKISGNLILIREEKGKPEYSLEYKIVSDVLYITYSADTDEPLVIAYKRVK